MRNNRRLRRMGRNKKKVPNLPLTSLMDVFTILVFFLLFHSAGGEAIEAPKQIKLPESVVEAKPRVTIVILVSPEVVVVQGAAVIKTVDLLNLQADTVDEITQRLKQLERNIIGITTKTTVERKEITILADKTIPFRALKKIMSTCTGSGYGKISLAVTQKNGHS
ncbi:MAG: biopolymer transporter ExbD [Desulfosarcina sp.]